MLSSCINHLNLGRDVGSDSSTLEDFEDHFLFFKLLLVKMRGTFCFTARLECCKSERSPCQPYFTLPPDCGA